MLSQVLRHLVIIVVSLAKLIVAVAVGAADALDVAAGVMAEGVGI